MTISTMAFPGPRAVARALKGQALKVAAGHGRDPLFLRALHTQGWREAE